MIKLIIAGVVGYLLGSISPAILLGRLKGIDIKKQGSGNAGTTNVLRVMGGKAAGITLAVDILKGIAAVILGGLIAGPSGAYLGAAAVFIGHVFPLYFRFKGGKGVATAFGGMLAVNWRVALLCLLVVAAVTLITKRMSAGSICGGLALPAFAGIWERGFFIYALIMGLLVIYNHRSNIKRLIRGQEPKLGILDRKK